MKIGIMGAMPEEIDLLKSEMINHNEQVIGKRAFVTGTLYGHDTTIVFSRWGKVASAMTATILIDKFNVDLIIFTGVAGAVNTDLSIGDIVIGNILYQHDMDARPIFPQFHIPLTETCIFQPDSNYVSKAEIASKHYLDNIHRDIPMEILEKFSIINPKVKRGIIATGDQFIENALTHPNMNFDAKKRADAVEMEGAAVAQICEDFDTSYLVIRTISDKADHSATINFQDFIREISNHYSRGIVKHLLEELTK